MKLIWAKRDVRVFLAGALSGIIFMAVVGAAAVWWKPRHELSDADVGLGPAAWGAIPANDARYDMCLAQTGSKVRCDALMRLVARETAAETARQEEAVRRIEATVKEEVAKSSRQVSASARSCSGRKRGASSVQR
jgi:hypothetical protein